MSSYAITGASRGLGFEYIRQLSTNPSNTVIALVRSPSTATQLQELAASQKNIHVIQCDVTLPAEVLAAAAATSAITHGALDVLVHNAADLSDLASFGITPSAMSPTNPAPVHAMFEHAMATAVYGSLWVTNAFLPLIEKGTQKKVVLISSGIADLDVIRRTEVGTGVPYGVAKAGMNIIAAKYAVELKGKGVKVLSMSPGWVDTFQGNVPPEMQEQIKGMMAELLASLQKYDPNVKGPSTPEESVRSQLEVIGRLDEAMSGRFVSHHGDENWI